MKLQLTSAMLAALVATVQAAELPPEITHQLPSGYDVLATANATFAGASRAYYMVALSRHEEGSGAPGPGPAPARPLLLFEQQANGSFLQTGRNDTVIMRADEGGQCDPFETDDGSGGIAVKGRYFTVENGVACGQHWTDYITFRFDEALGGYIFDNERLQSWSLNNSTDPDADALVPDGPPEVRRGDRKRPMPFENWRPSR
jgi:hypothetical protein